VKDWIPVLQELIWPIFIGLLILWNKAWFKEILATIKKRVEDGSELNVGPGGLSVGQAPVLPDEVNEEDIIDDGYKSQGEVPLGEAEKPSVENQISLSHRTTFWKMKNGRAYYRILITTHAETEDAKSKIDKVVYHLHPTFKNSTRVISTPENNFLLKTNGWGEFLAKAEIHIKGSAAPIKMNRYIELKA
jgi:hypothetical protein